jgi:hypothetical protein
MVAGRGQKGGSVVSHMAAHPCSSPPAGEAHMIGDGSVCPQLCTGPPEGGDARSEGPQMWDRAHVLRTGAQGWASPFPCTQAVWQAPLSLPAGVPHKQGSPGNGNGPPSPCLHACTKARMSGEVSTPKGDTRTRDVCKYDPAQPTCMHHSCALPVPCMPCPCAPPLHTPCLGVTHALSSVHNLMQPVCMGLQMWGGACQVAYERWGVQGWCTWTGCTWHMKGEVQDWCMQAGCTGSCR